MEGTSLENKLFILRDIGGRPNKEAIQTVREIEQRLSSNPEFIGLALRGSIIRGYSTKTSDVDLTILWDSSLSSDYFSTLRKFQNIAEEKSMNSTREPRGEFKVRDINPSIISGVSKSHLDERALANIFRLVTGKKIEAYRQYWIESLQKIPKKDREKILNGTAYELAYDDLLGWDKMVERISGIKRPPVKLENLAFRRRLWQEQIEKIPGVPKYKNFYKKRLELWHERLNRFFIEQEGTVSKRGVVRRGLKKIGIFH